MRTIKNKLTGTLKITRQIVAGPRCPIRLSIKSPAKSAITTTIKDTQPVSADNPASVRFFVRGE